MNSSLINRILLPILFLLSIAGIDSCKKTKDFVAKPMIGTPPYNGIDSITIGASLVIHTNISNPEGVSFEWMVNGATTSTDSTLTFTPATRGDYTIGVKATNEGGSVIQYYQFHVWDKYENGFFILNEGSYGSIAGNLSFFRYNTGLLEDSVFTKENPGKDFEPSTASLEFGAIYNNKIYLLSKYGGPLVVADAFSLKETGRVASSVSNDWRAFAGIDETSALVSTGDGLYPLNLQTLALGTKLAGIGGEVTDLLKLGNYVFALSATNGLIVINATDKIIAKTIPGLSVGITKSMDGAIWTAGDSALVRLDPTTLDTTHVDLPFEVNGSFGFWHPGSITASTKENAVYIAYNGAYSGATSIYKYVTGNTASVLLPLINIEAGKELYGAGLSYDAMKDRIVVSTVKSGYGVNYSINDLYFFDPIDGAQIMDVSYSGYYFPAMHVYH